tara:strand:+ start:2827 stop:3108 length:282 start_codon:yes stop_codon:yes gene_type:complete
MALEASTQQKLKDWVMNDNWFKESLLEEQQYYDFVYQYYKDHGSIIDEASLQRDIKNEIKRCNTEIANLDEEVRGCVSLAVKICGFLGHHNIE